jgi:uncharacterized protein (TIGR02145 family)
VPFNRWPRFVSSGWNVPADADWITLSDFLGGAGVAGGKLKEANFYHFQSPNTGANNSTGFTGLPGGNHTSIYNNITKYGNYWSSKEDGGTPGNAFIRRMNYNNAEIFTFSTPKFSGMSIHCIKDAK